MRKILNKIVLIEYEPEGIWTINYNKHNHETDVKIPKWIAKLILKLKTKFNGNA